MNAFSPSDENPCKSRHTYMMTIQNLTHALTQPFNTTELLGEIMQQAVAHIDAAGAGDIFLWDGSQQCLIPHVWHNLGDWLRNVRLQLGEGVAGTAAQQRKSVAVNDYENSPYASGHFTRRLTHTAVMAAPMLHHDNLLGAITVGNEGTGRSFDAGQVHKLELFADLATLTLLLGS